ncbi:hypothetical protein M434DRAFT_27105 [Hypoxylon sp. CO27-5]|nr:hypothetical protein M434DRAFT_27105 [Hypoxylon sp. CO27-5]
MSSDGRGGGSSGGGGNSGGHSGDTPRGEKEMTGSNASGRRGGHHESTGKDATRQSTQFDRVPQSLRTIPKARAEVDDQPINIRDVGTEQYIKIHPPVLNDSDIIKDGNARARVLDLRRPAHADHHYARIFYRVEAYHGCGKFMPHSLAFRGPNTRSWNHNRSMHLRKLTLFHDGIYRIQFEIMRHRWIGDDTVVQTLFTQNIHVKSLPAYSDIYPDEVDNGTAKGK